MTNQQAFEALDQKRKICLAACVLGAFVVGLAYTWSVLQTPFVQQLGGEAVRATVVLCYTLTVVSSTMSPSIFGSFTRKLGVKKTVLLGTVMFGLGYIVSGQTTNMALFYLAFGLGTGVGSGFIYPSIMGYMANLFPDKRGVVSGLIAGVYGGAAIFWSPLLAQVIAAQNLAIALWGAGIVSLAVIIPVALTLQPIPEGYVEYKMAGLKAAAGKKASLNLFPDLNRGQMVKTTLFYVALTAFAFGCTSGMMVISQVSPMLQEGFAMTATRAAGYVSLMSLMSMLGRFLWGTVTDYTDKYVTLAIITGLPAVTMGVLASSPSETITVVAMALTALCYGGFGSTITPITADLFGAKYVTENYGVMYAAFGFAGLVGPQAAVRLSNGGDYSGAFMMACVLSVIAFFCVVSILKIRRDRIKAAPEA